tara:strand:- start:340 stop:558 length:219 start_codon:yes stop_codon:yes gene_type:complete
MGSYISSTDNTAERLRELEARLLRLETSAPATAPRRKSTPALSSRRPTGAHGALMKELMERRRAIIAPAEED